MEINKSQKRMLIILAAVLAFAVYTFISDKDRYLSYYTGKKPPVQKATVSPTQNTAEARQNTDHHIYTTWGRDPFAQIIREAGVKKSRQPVAESNIFRLSAISYMGNNSVALINDNVVKIGEQLAGYTVSSIEPRRVILSKNSEKIVLNLQISKE
jgi:hypothetical protein